VEIKRENINLAEMDARSGPTRAVLPASKTPLTMRQGGDSGPSPAVGNWWGGTLSGMLEYPTEKRTGGGGAGAMGVTTLKHSALHFDDFS